MIVPRAGGAFPAGVGEGFLGGMTREIYTAAAGYEMATASLGLRHRKAYDSGGLGSELCFSSGV